MSPHQIQSLPISGVSERGPSNEREESDGATEEAYQRASVHSISSNTLLANFSLRTSVQSVSKRERIPIAPHTRVREQNYRICEQRRAQFLFTHRTGLNPRWFHHISHIFLKFSCKNPFTPNLERGNNQQEITIRNDRSEPEFLIHSQS